MAHNFPYLNDSSFLKKFDKIKLKEQFVKIIVLNFNETPIQQIQGKVTGGNFSFDGTSALRRTGNLNLVANEYENDLTKIKNLLSINKKIEVLIGFINNTDQYQQYKILWFPQGIYVIINPNISDSINGINISLTLHDKMALLNGECGGVLPASIVLNEIEDIDENGQTIILQPTIFRIIQELVNHFGNEQLGKIIIADLDNRAKKIMKWTGSTPLYYYHGTNNDYSTMSTNYQTVESQAPVGVTIQQFNYGDDVGYVFTDFTYPGELISKAGDTVTSILDQIVNLLGNYEYFYDINGNFIFQEIKNYLNKSYSSYQLDQINNQNYLVDYTGGKSVYTFDDSDIIMSVSNSPQYQQIKNDFIVWGKRKSLNGKQIPIRYHLTIDKKPQVGNSYQHVHVYTNEIDGSKKYKIEDSGGVTITTSDFRTELFLSGVAAQPLALEGNYYYTELQNEWYKIYNIEQGYFEPQALAHPDEIDFFLDFIDSQAEIGQYNVENIGRRTIVTVDDSINCIFAPDIPDLVIIKKNQPDTSQQREECINKGQAYVQVDEGIYDMLSLGGVLKSAYEEIKKSLYQYTTFNEQVSLTTLPIYYLEPNTRITIRNTATGIYGDFMIKSISLPLDINGSMNITCTKALENI